MSEYSESYHLRTEHIGDAIDLLRRAGLKGYAYQPTNGWVTFVVEEGTFEPDTRIAASARQPILHYVSTEDHGWSFTLFNGGKQVTGYRCDWDPEIEFDDSRYSRHALGEFIPIAQPSLLDDFEKRLRPQNMDDIFELELPKAFAQAIGLKHFDWLSYNYMASDFHKSPEDYTDVTKVG